MSHMVPAWSAYLGAFVTYAIGVIVGSFIWDATGPRAFRQ